MEKISKSYNVNYRVPERSVLGLCFFLLFVNDLRNVSKFNTTLFADDTNLHLSHHNIKSLQSQTTEEIRKINNWINIDKLTISYKKSCFTLVTNKQIVTSNFKICINQNLISITDNVKYLGVYVDNKLSWKTHINNLCFKLSKVRGIIFTLRHFVPLSTLRLVCYAMFHSHIQYSLLNWGRAAKSHFDKLSTLQNKILRAFLFRPWHSPTNYLYPKCRVLKLVDMIKMEKAKFMFKYNNKMLPMSFDNCFLKLEKVHKYNTRQKVRNEYFLIYSRTESGRKALHHLCLKVWKEMPLKFRRSTFYRFKKYYKYTILTKYDDVH